MKINFLSWNKEVLFQANQAENTVEKEAQDTQAPQAQTAPAQTQSGTTVVTPVAQADNVEQLAAQHSAPVTPAPYRAPATA